MLQQDEPFGVLFVCTGNICRSPTADGILRHMVREAGLEAFIRVDSAGTAGYHIGDPPDQRSVAMAHSRGIDIGDLRARQVTRGDFANFEWVIAMDEGHHAALELLAAGANKKGQIRRFLAFTGDAEGNVPDPYYGASDGFMQVFDMVEAGCAAILGDIRRNKAI